MTDLFLRPTWDVVDVAMSNGPVSQTRESLRAERCTEHRHGQFAKHICPDCHHEPGERKYDANRSERVRRQKILHAAARAVLAECAPTSYGEFALLINQRSGLKIRACHAGEILKWLRRRGETTVMIRNLQTRKLIESRQRRLAAAETNP